MKALSIMHESSESGDALVQTWGIRDDVAEAIMAWLGTPLLESIVSAAGRDNAATIMESEAVFVFEEDP